MARDHAHESTCLNVTYTLVEIDVFKSNVYPAMPDVAHVSGCQSGKAVRARDNEGGASASTCRFRSASAFKRQRRA